MSEDDEEGWTSYAPLHQARLPSSRTPLSKARRLAARDRELTEQRFAHAPFPLYGLPPSWEGEQFLGGGEWGSLGGREETSALSLVHGTIVEGEVPMLVVETAALGRSGGGRALRILAEFLWPGEATTVREALGRHRGIMRQDPDLDPSSTRAQATVPVEGRPVDFDVVSGHTAWVAQAKVGTNKVTIEGRDGFDIRHVQLVQVHDLGPYIEGTRRFEGSTS